MPEIQKVAVLGAGAMGSVLASQFFTAPGISTAFIARGQRRDQLERDGVLVNGRTYFIPAIDPDEADAPADLIIVALKHHQLEEALQNLGKLVGDSTLFLSVMNGLESEETIGALYGMDKVLYAISVGVDALRAGNQVTYTIPGVHYFGEKENIAISARVRRVQQAFDRAGIKYKNPEDMLRMLWWKFMVNVGINQASAVLNAPYGVFQTDPNALGLMEALMQEAVTLAKASHVNLTDADIKDWYPVMNTLSPLGKTSMLQDIEAGRRTELDIFAGKVIAMGKEKGIPTPVNQTIFQIIRVLEQK